LKTHNTAVKLKKLEFDWNEAFKQDKEIKKGENIVKLTEHSEK
jgi:hypothetical protein